MKMPPLPLYLQYDKISQQETLGIQSWVPTHIFCQVNWNICKYLSPLLSNVCFGYLKLIDYQVVILQYLMNGFFGSLMHPNLFDDISFKRRVIGINACLLVYIFLIYMVNGEDSWFQRLDWLFLVECYVRFISWHVGRLIWKFIFVTAGLCCQSIFKLFTFLDSFVVLL